MAFEVKDQENKNTNEEQRETRETRRERNSSERNSSEREQRRRAKRGENMRRRGNDEDFEEDDDDNDRSNRRVVSRRNPVLNPQNSATRGMQFIKQYEELMENHKQTESVLLSPMGNIDGEKVDAALTVLVYATNIGGDVFYHPIIIESKANPVKVRNQSRRGRERYRDSGIEVKRFTSTYDGVDGTFAKRIEAYVREEIATDGEYVSSDVTIVPSYVDLDDVNNVRKVLFLADNANYTIANADDAYTPECLNRGTRMRALLTFNQDVERIDYLDTSIRADFSICLTEVNKSNSDSGIFANEGDEDIVEIHGYVSAGYVGTDIDVSRVHDIRDLDNACYAPEINISDIDTSIGEPGAEFDRMVLALSTIPVVNTNGNYLRPFEENSREENRSVAAFAFGMEWIDDEVPEDDGIDDDPKKCSRFLRRMFVSDDADVCYTVREGGANFTLGKLFLDMANDDEGAVDRFVVSMDNVTSDKFSKLVDREFKSDLNPSDIVTGVVRLPAGYIRDGKKRLSADIIDTQYVVNKLRGNNMELLLDFFECTSPDGNAFNREESDTRLLRVYEEVTGGQFVHTGFQYKCYLGGRVLQLCYNAVQDSDMRVTIDTDGVSSQRTLRRGRTERDSLRSNTARRRGRMDDRDNDRNRRGDRYRSTSYRY